MRSIALVTLALFAGAAFAQESDRRLYALPEDLAAGHEANQALPKDERQWMILLVPTHDIHDRETEVGACHVEIEAQYPTRAVPAQAPDWCEEDPGTSPPECSPVGTQDAPTKIAETVQAEQDETISGLSVLLHGLGGRVDVDVWCEGPGGVGDKKGVHLQLPGAGPPREPTVQSCSHAVEHASQVVCQPITGGH